MKKILYLTLKKEPFDKILSGEKKEECRKSTPYWLKRIFDDNGLKHDEILFRNGYYSNKSPWMRVELLGYEIDNVDEVIYLKLGKILETGNLK